MAATARQPKPRKGMPDSNARRAPVWSTGARASPTFSPAGSNTRLPNVSQPASPGFPPLSQTNGGPRSDRPQDRILQQLSGLTGTTITLSTKTKQRYEGVIGSTSGEGDTTGVTLKDVKELTQPGAPLKDQLFIAATNIDTWSSGPADAKAPNGTDSFKTDTDISQKAALRRERELQAWQPVSPEDSTLGALHSPAGAGGRNAGSTDDLTFGPGASSGKISWDQFDANEKLFGVKTSFDEQAYTTPLNRDAPDYKEREKKAQQLANEILGATASNPHVAEERVMNFSGDNATNEEEKYGAVVRSANAYIPPAARKGATGGLVKEKDKDKDKDTTATTTTKTADGAPKPDIPKLSVNAPDGSSVAVNNAASPATKPAADAAFREFVTSEKDRMLKKRQALVKHEMDKRMAELVKFSKSFKLNKPIPDDLVPILAKDEEKQRQIKEKSTRDAESAQARTIGPLTTTTAAAGATTNNIGPSATSTKLAQPTPSSAKPPAAVPEIAKAGLTSAKSSAAIAAKSGAGGTGKEGAAKSGRISMVIQAIPPFKGKRASVTPTNGASAAGTSGAAGTSTTTQVQAGAGVGAVRTGSAASPLSPAAANRLNVNASSFRPNGKAFSPVSSPGVNGAAASPKPKDASTSQNAAPNPFFGNRPIKRVPPVSIKEDFNPFKHNKVVDANQVGAMWPYSGKRYMQVFPPPSAQHPQPQQSSPHMAPPGPPPPVPPPTEYNDDPAAQAAARGYMYAYPPYGYPGQMMPGMPPPPPGYLPGPYMQPMPYPMPPPGTMYPGTPMGQMPPPGFVPQHMPPGPYPPPPNGAGPRPSMPSTPIPHHAHAHPYYHQSPQLQHAVPYPMMMPPPPGTALPHPYDATQAPPVPMGGVSHG